jgi:predicted nuclease of predicted toxin-antitoxin system
MGSGNSPERENSSGVTTKPIVYVDAMFSWRVANLIRELGYETFHVSALGGIKNNDKLIWKIAEERSAIVFTKDKDFLQLINSGSKARLLIYVGYNSKRSRILNELTPMLPEALQKLSLGLQLVRIP